MVRAPPVGWRIEWDSLWHVQYRCANLVLEFRWRNINDAGFEEWAPLGQWRELWSTPAREALWRSLFLTP